MQPIGILSDSDSDKELLRHLIERGTTEADYGPRQVTQLGAGNHLIGLQLLRPPKRPFNWPAGLAPVPQPIAVEPQPTDPLPKADVLVVTWTVDEVDALADVFTPGYNRNEWYRYSRNFVQHYQALIRKNAPAFSAKRLGSYFPTRIENKSVLCVKSELHLNQDGIGQNGHATLPVKDFWQQIIEEVQPSLVITVGTAGATFPDHQLGDVIITRAAQFRLTEEFRAEHFSRTKYQCTNFQIPTTRFNEAQALMQEYAQHLAEPAFGPPTKQYPWQGPYITAPANVPDIKIDGRDFAPFHPMLTTDKFEFGTSANNLDADGCGVEMGDAVLGMVVDEMAKANKPVPDWLVIRNASDPQINGDLPGKVLGRVNMQAHWAVWYYETYGYWTSINSALATWAVIAG